MNAQRVTGPLHSAVMQPPSLRMQILATVLRLHSGALRAHRRKWRPQPGALHLRLSTTKR